MRSPAPPRPGSTTDGDGPPSGTGSPPQGRAKLEHAYDDLAVAAMRQLREIGGDDAVRTFARRRIDTILSGVTEGPSDVEADGRQGCRPR